MAPNQVKEYVKGERSHQYRRLTQLKKEQRFCELCNKEMSTHLYLEFHMINAHNVFLGENKRVFQYMMSISQDDLELCTYRCDACNVSDFTSMDGLRRHKLELHRYRMRIPQMLAVRLGTEPIYNSKDSGESKEHVYGQGARAVVVAREGPKISLSALGLADGDWNGSEGFVEGYEEPENDGYSRDFSLEDNEDIDEEGMEDDDLADEPIMTIMPDGRIETEESYNSLRLSQGSGKSQGVCSPSNLTQISSSGLSNDPTQSSSNSNTKGNQQETDDGVTIKTEIEEGNNKISEHSSVQIAVPQRLFNWTGRKHQNVAPSQSSGSATPKNRDADFSLSVKEFLTGQRDQIPIAARISRPKQKHKCPACPALFSSDVTLNMHVMNEHFEEVMGNELPTNVSIRKSPTNVGNKDQTPAWKQSPTERREPPHNRPVEMPTNSRNIMSAQGRPKPVLETKHPRSEQYTGPTKKPVKIDERIAHFSDVGLHDDSAIFALSIAASLRKMDIPKREFVKMRLQQVLYECAYGGQKTGQLEGNSGAVTKAEPPARISIRKESVEKLNENSSTESEQSESKIDAEQDKDHTATMAQ
ncbi:Zinc finger, C2H2 type family protein [Ditylenchus destructor]|uniref:Zinc finger, C2H2 type family protein n=1 Tax=Ditylenchus destructor TaxID=166010 RepID=A0AAD4N4J6_9BILA|nr:Zinc finger, C2H2 type family protein [Ditylenchus destructor]